MSNQVRLRSVARLIGLLGLCLVSTGCRGLWGHADQTAAAPPRQSAAVVAQYSSGTPLPGQRTAQHATLTPRTEVTWTLESPERPAPLMTGQSVVGPDGTLVLGPYGTYQVAGMTLTQAGASIEQKLRAHVAQPRIKLQTVATAPVSPAPVPAAAAPLPRPTTAPSAGPLPRRETQPTVWQSQAAAERQDRVLNTVWTSAGPSDPRVVQVSARAQAATTPTVFQAPVESVPVLETPAASGNSTSPGPEAVSVPSTENLAPGTQQAGHVAHPLLHHPYQHFDAPHGVLPPLPREDARVSLPTYVIAPPDILQVESLKGLLNQPVQGPHLVRPDGTIGLGSYGSVPVAGRTLDAAKLEIARVIHARLDPRVVKLQEVIEGLSVDVLAYNSKVYYVITDGGGVGEQITRLPVTGNETVLDALSLNPVRTGGIFGLGPVASRHHIWVARPTAEGKERVLPVDYIAITQKGDPSTNWQLLPGDRVYVKADSLRALNVALDKLLSPVERILGVTLLGSQTVNSIRFGTLGN